LGWLKGDKKVNIGIVQMQVTTDINGNINNMLSDIKKASKQQIDFLCFPECSLSGYVVDHNAIDYEAIKNNILKLKNASYKFNISLLIGTSWKSQSKKIFNTAIIIKRESKTTMKYYKNELTELDRKYFSKPEPKPGLYSLCPFWINESIKCGVLICKDQNNPLLAMMYKKNNVRVLFYLSSHHYKKQEAIHKQRKNMAFPIVRAIENRIYVAKADAVGEQNGLISMGCSMVVNPEGEVIAEAKKWKTDLLKFNL
jgi:predicted amidohydrolase